MSVRNGFVLLLALSTLTFLVACGGGGGASIPNPTPPPTGSFSTSNLNGTYVFSVSGTDTGGSPFAIVGTFTANGSGGITAGALDINTLGVVPAPNVAVGSSSYTLGVDGRGTITLNAAAPIGKVGLDFVLQDSSHGLIIEYDGNASGSGTLDLQTAGATPSGTYAFSFSGADGNTGNSFATVGAFTLGSGGAITSGLEDFNDGGFPYTNQSLAGSVVAGPSSTPGTTLTTQQFSTQTFDVFPIDANHLKFIEMDTIATFSGDAFSQTSTSNTVPTGSLAFTLAGFISNAPAAVGGFMVTDGSGNITTASTQDVNDFVGASPSPLPLSGTYAAAGTGRFTLSFATGFAGGSLYAAYPSDGGLLLLEIDNPGGIMAGVASLQSSTAFSTSQGYGLNLTGVNLGATTGSTAEVDDIAEFAANSSGTTVTGIVDENWAPGGTPIIPVTLNGTYLAPDSNGRGQISATAGTSSSTTLNGGFLLTFYTVDGTTFPFIESDGGQVATGVFVQQNPAAVSSATAHSRMFITRPMVRGHAARSKKQK